MSILVGIQAISGESAPIQCGCDIVFNELLPEAAHGETDSVFCLALYSRIIRPTYLVWDVARLTDSHQYESSANAAHRVVSPEASQARQ